MADNTGAWVEGDYGGNALKIRESVKRASLTPRQALPTDADVPEDIALAEPVPTELDNLTADIDAFLNEPRPEEPAPVDDNLSATPRDYGLVTWSGVEDIAGAVGGATQWLSTLLPDAPAEVVRQIGKTTSEFWAGESDKTKKHMSAEAQELYSRPFLPEEGQKGAFDDWSAIPLKFMASAPAMLLTMSPIAAAAKLGYGAKALVAIGAVTEGGLATSFTANEVAEAVDGLSDEEIRALPKYNELREQDNSHEDIKNAIRDDAIRVAGLVAGASSAALGGAGAAVFGKVLNATGLDNFLPKMHVPKGRLGAAAMALPTEGVQEAGQEFGEQVAGNIGKSTYNPEQDLFEGGGEAAVGGGVLGAAGGATVAGVVGPNQAPAIADPVVGEETDTGPDAVRQNAQPPPAEAPPQPGFIAGQVTDEQLQAPDGQTTQEPIADIAAQLDDMIDPDTDRKAVFIPKATIDTEAGQALLEQIDAHGTILTLDDTTNETGQLFTEDKDLLALWKKKSKNGKRHDEAVLAQILGYDTSKSEITDPNAPVVETTLPDGATLTGEVAKPADVEAVVAKQEEQAPPEAVVEVKDAAQGQVDRKAKVRAEEEQAAARVANVTTNANNPRVLTEVTNVTRQLVESLQKSIARKPDPAIEAAIQPLATIEAALNQSNPEAVGALLSALNEIPTTRSFPAAQRKMLAHLLESGTESNVDMKLRELATQMRPARKKGTGGKEVVAPVAAPDKDTTIEGRVAALKERLTQKLHRKADRDAYVSSLRDAIKAQLGTEGKYHQDDVEAIVAKLNEYDAKTIVSSVNTAPSLIEAADLLSKARLAPTAAEVAAEQFPAKEPEPVEQAEPIVEAPLTKEQELSAKRKARLAARKASTQLKPAQAAVQAPVEDTATEAPTTTVETKPAGGRRVIKKLPPKKPVQKRAGGSVDLDAIVEEDFDAVNEQEAEADTGRATASDVNDSASMSEVVEAGLSATTDPNASKKQKQKAKMAAAKLSHGEKKFTAIEKQIAEQVAAVVKASQTQKDQERATKEYKNAVANKESPKLIAELKAKKEALIAKKAQEKAAWIELGREDLLYVAEKATTVGTEAGPANIDDYESQDGVETARLGEPTNGGMVGKNADIGKAAIAHVGDPEATIKKLRKLLKKAFNTKAIDFADVHQMRQLMQGDNASMDMLGVEHVGLQELLTGLKELLPEGHPQRQMVDLFITLGHDVPVIMYNSSQDTNSDRPESWHETADSATGLVGNRGATIDGRRISSVVDPNAQYMGLNTDKIVELIGIALEPDANFRLQEYVVGSLISLITHESAHVATIRAMRDPRNHLEVEQLESLMHAINDSLVKQRGKGILTDAGVIDTSGGIGYGFSDVYEFVAEALSNPEFQQLLMTTRVPRQHTKHFSPTRSKIATAWQAFVSSVGKLLKVKPVNKDAFTEVLALTQDLVETAKQADTRALSLKQEVREMLQEDDGGDLLSGGVIPSYEKMSETLGTHRANRMSRAVTAVTKLPSRGALGWHQLDQIFRRFGSRMGQSMKDYASHVAHKQAIVTQERKLADKISRAWHKAVAANPKWADKLSSVMKESTIAGLDASAPFTDVRNKHAWKNPAKRKEHAKLRAQYKALPAEMQGIYTKVGKYFQNQRARTQRYAVDNLINSYPSLKGNPNLAAKVLKAVDKLDVESAITGAARGQMNPAQISALVKHIGKIKALTEVKGVYFPLRRYGNYVVSAKRTPAPMLFSTKEMAKAYIQEVEANLIPGLQPNSTAKLDKVNKRLVHFEEYAVEMYESEHAANVGYERLRKEFDGGEIESPRIRQDSDMQAGGQQYAKLVQQIKSNVGNSRYNAGIDAALIQLMAENSVRKSELARQGVAGASGDMNRAFAERAMAGSWTMADLRVGRDQAETMEIMQKTADNHADPKTRLTLGAVVKELKTREEGDVQDRQQRPVIDFITKTGYYWFLASPSYVIQNATQIFLVTGPYLGAKFGHAKTFAAMLKNIKQVMPDLLSEVKDTGFGVVDMPENIVDNTIKKWGGDADPAVHMETNAAKTKGDMLRWLLDRGRIDATFIQELYQSVQGTDPGKMTKVMGYATTWAKAWPQMVEQMNRIVTAGAAYDLAIGKKKSQLEAMYAAEEAVLETQLDYSNTNRARHMKLGGYGRVIFMFKTYSQGITALMIKSVAAAAGRGDISRGEGANTLISLMISHSLAGGILGGVMTQPVRMIYAAIKELFGDDDEFKSVDDYIEDWTLSMSKAGLEAAGISTEYAAKVAEAASRGLPRVWGSDMHSSLGLHNIIGLSAQPTDSTRDKALHYMVQMLGPVAATGATAAGGWDYFNKGEYSKMIESITPKGVRSLIRAKRFNDEGVTDYTGTPILESDQLNGWHIFNEALGVPSAPKSRMYEQRGSVKLYEQKQLKAATMLRERWRNTTPAKRHVSGGIMEEIRSFNRANPGAAITMDTLYSSKMAQREKAAAARNNQFGKSATYKDLPWAK